MRRIPVWSRALAYMLLVGGLHFALVPALLLRSERRGGATLLRGKPASLVGGGLVAAGVGLAGVSGYWLVTRGVGTPFPLDPTRRLVTNGPYGYVRNPQAIAATLIVAGEVLAIRSRRLWLLLPLTLLYLEGLARPIEQRQLLRQFGEPYRAYIRRVPRWLPLGTRPVGAQRAKQ